MLLLVHSKKQDQWKQRNQKDRGDLWLTLHMLHFTCLLGNSGWHIFAQFLQGKTLQLQLISIFPMILTTAYKALQFFTFSELFWRSQITIINHHTALMGHDYVLGFVVSNF